MIHEDQTPKIGKRRLKRYFSLEDKKRYYNLWQASGLTRERFCQEQDLVLSAFGKWCRKLSSPDKASLVRQNDWAPVVTKENILDIKKEPVVLEVKIANSAKIYFFSLLIILLLKEFIHAIAVIW